MGKTYTELEAWGIFGGALIIGIVLTSIFWAYLTVPAELNISNEIINESKKSSLNSSEIVIPEDFVNFCKKISGTPNWDSLGFRQCTVKDSSDKSLFSMNLLCKKFNLSISYGSFGVKCEGKV